MIVMIDAARSIADHSPTPTADRPLVCPTWKRLPEAEADHALIPDRPRHPCFSASQSVVFLDITTPHEWARPKGCHERAMSCQKEGGGCPTVNRAATAACCRVLRGKAVCVVWLFGSRLCRCRPHELNVDGHSLFHQKIIIDRS